MAAARAAHVRSSIAARSKPRAKALIPAIIEEGVKIPLEFRRLQAADLSHWRGDPADRQLPQFFESIERALKRTGPMDAAPASDSRTTIDYAKACEPPVAPAVS